MKILNSLYKSWWLIFSCVVGILIFTGCKNSETLDGMWVSEEDDRILFFKENIIYPSEGWPTEYSILNDTIWTCDVIYPLDNFKIPFKLKGNSLWMKIGYSEEDLLFKKSKFDNIFDHKIDQLGMKLDLQKGFSKSPLSKKVHYKFITVGYEYCFLKYFLGEKELKSNEFKKELAETRPNIPTCVLSIDKNLPFEKFKELKFYHSISNKGYLPCRYIHAVRNKPQRFFFGTEPWEQVSYEKINFLNFESEILKELGKEVNLIDLEVDASSNLLINKKIVQEVNFLSECKNAYDPKTTKTDPRKTIFRIIESKDLTYGNFLFFYSAIRKVVSNEKEKYAQENYNKSWEEIKYKNKDDTIRTRIRDSFPMVVSIKDTP